MMDDEERSDFGKGGKEGEMEKNERCYTFGLVRKLSLTGKVSLSARKKFEAHKVLGFGFVMRKNNPVPKWDAAQTKNPTILSTIQRLLPVT
jgi:hypothetical protein